MCLSLVKTWFSQRYQVLIPGTHKCYFIWQSLCRCGYMKNTEVMRESWIIQVDPKCNHMYPWKREAEGDFTAHRGQRHVKTEQRGNGGLWLWKLESCGSRQGRLAATWSWKRQGTDSPFQPLEGAGSCRHFAFGPVKLASDSWPSELWENYVVNHCMLLIYYRNHRKQIR